MTGIWEHEGNVENKSSRRVFSTFLECSQMLGVFYHIVIRSLGFFIWFIEVMWCKTIKSIKHAFSLFYSDKIWVFDQLEPAQGPIYMYIIKSLIACQVSYFQEVDGIMIFSL